MGAHRCGHADRAIRVLIVLENRDERSPHGKAGSVQRVHEVRLAAGAAIRILVMLSIGNRQLGADGKASEPRTQALYHTSKALLAQPELFLPLI